MQHFLDCIERPVHKDWHRNVAIAFREVDRGQALPAPMISNIEQRLANPTVLLAYLRNVLHPTSSVVDELFT